MQTHLKLRHLSEVKELEPYHKRAKAAKVDIQTERVKPTIETKDTKQPDAKRTRSDMLLTGGIKSEIRNDLQIDCTIPKLKMVCLLVAS